MTAFLLSVHVLAAILTVGPIAIASSMFPPALAAAEAKDDPRKPAVAAVLHRITRVYAVVGILVPVFGLATAAGLGVLTDAWLIASIVLTSAAATILITRILPGQRFALAAIDANPSAEGTSSRARRRLAMDTGIFNLLWAIVVVLMVYRPGSTTGVGP
ncbi:hypothetical protein [Glycomyces xiaoerkulensis]|uniref:hypothetical protein n=1 Tax=Glycomyces xiaoerkulensis TaxID=2038139 RepID=UPI000C25E907|nr:hypothetical protein [Glycomyces xiaoerkulensis]